MYRGGKARTRQDDMDGVARRTGSPVPIPENLKITTRDMGHHRHRGSEASPVLPPLHSTVGSYGGSLLQPMAPQPARLPEDQRMIHMLNSRYIS